MNYTLKLFQSKLQQSMFVYLFVSRPYMGEYQEYPRLF